MIRQKQAPVARTPPVLPQIPGVTKNLDEVENQEQLQNIEETSEENKACGDKSEPEKNNESIEDQDQGNDEELDMEM